jgi:hypothetical protein
MSKTSKYALSVLIMLSVVHFCSCIPALHPTFVESKVAEVREGMFPSDIIRIFGPPDLEFKTTFGRKTGQTWEALVYKYHTVPDTLYHHIKHFRTNTFVFFAGTNPPRLNNWQIEYLYREKH